jgi:hypothetical protein
MKNDESCACVGCGRGIDKYQSPGEQGDRAVEVRVGKVLESQVINGQRRRGRPRLNSEKFKPESTWGLMHLDCFLKAIEAPDPVFAGFSSR